MIDGVLDVTIPGGSGWTVNKKGTRWRYDDPAGAIAGVRRVDLADRSSARAPGRLTFTIRIVGSPAMPVVGPVDVSVRFGIANECARAHWNGPAATKPHCRGSAARMTCG